MLHQACGASVRGRAANPTLSAAQASRPFVTARRQTSRATPQRIAPRAAADASTTAAEAVWEGDLRRFQRLPADRVEAPPNAPPVVILPGFGNKTEDYTAPFGNEEASIATALQRRGFRVYVVPLERKDWFKVGRAIFTLAYWRGSCTTHPGYTWYLERVKAVVDQARQDTGCDQVDLLGHSAGGWLGRAFVGQAEFRDGGVDASADTLGSADSEPHPAVRSLVTLGTPHTPPPPEKVKDMTGGALTWVDTTWPGAFFADQGVAYVSVAGRAVRGNKDAERRSLSGYAHGSYLQVCGEGHRTEGDVVVPLSSALLAGSEHVVLDGVFHSMSRVGSYNDPGDRPWYGSDVVIDTWLHHLVK